MWLRANIVLAVAVVFAVLQMFASVTGGPRTGDSIGQTSLPDQGLTRSVLAQEDDNDDDDDDNDDDDDDNDDDDDDNDDDDDDNDDDDDDDNDDDGDDDNDDDDDDNDDDDCEDVDNDEDCDEDDDNDEDEDNDEDDGGDNEDIDDEGDDDEDDDDAPISTTPGAAPGVTPPPTAPVTQVQGVSAGTDMIISLQGDRVNVQAWANMPPGVTLTLRKVDPLRYAAVPGIRAGDLIFEVVAVDASGVALTTLPAEITVSVHYNDTDVIGLDETFLSMSRLNPVDGSWYTAPNLMLDALGNWIWATVFEAGVYAVHVP